MLFNRPSLFALIVVLFLILLPTVSCFDFDPYIGLPGGYGWGYADNNQNRACIDSDKGGYTSCDIAPMVFAFGANNDFIIAKQHPLPPHVESAIEEKVTNWFIIEVARKRVNGPLDEQQYLELRKELGVPDKLDFTATVQPRQR